MWAGRGGGGKAEAELQRMRGASAAHPGRSSLVAVRQAPASTYPSVIRTPPFPPACTEHRRAEALPLLALSVPVFYSLPMLGLSLFYELERERLALPECERYAFSTPRDQLEYALGETHLDEFLSMLAAPEVERVSGLQLHAVSTCSEALAAVGRVD